MKAQIKKDSPFYTSNVHGVQNSFCGPIEINLMGGVVNGVQHFNLVGRESITGFAQDCFIDHNHLPLLAYDVKNFYDETLSHYGVSAEEVLSVLTNHWNPRDFTIFAVGNTTEGLSGDEWLAESEWFEWLAKQENA
jgi:hypothetical protein